MPSLPPSLSESPPASPSASLPLDFFLSYLASWRALSRVSGRTRVGEPEELVAAASLVEGTPAPLRVGSTAAAVMARPLLVLECVRDPASGYGRGSPHRSRESLAGLGGGYLLCRAPGRQHFRGLSRFRIHASRYAMYTPHATPRF